MQRGIGSQELLQLFRHLSQLVVREHAIDAAVEPPDEVARANRLSEKYTDPVDGTCAKLCLDQA